MLFTKMTRKDIIFIWRSKKSKVFNTLKKKFTTKSILITEGDTKSFNWLFINAYAYTYLNTMYLILKPKAYLLFRLQSLSAQATIRYFYLYESPENVIIL